MAEDRRLSGVIPLEQQPSRLSGIYDFVTRSNSSLNLSTENGVVEGSFVETCLKNHKLRNLPIDKISDRSGPTFQGIVLEVTQPSSASATPPQKQGSRRPSQTLTAPGIGLEAPMYPTLESYAHFHYEYVQFPQTVVFAVPQVTRLETVQDKYGMSHKVFTVVVTSGDSQWKIRRTFSQFQNLDAQIHHCMHSRAYTKLPDLSSIKVPESTLPQVEQKRKVLSDYMENLERFMNPSPKVGCTVVLSWLQLDNTGSRLRHCREEYAAMNVRACAYAKVVQPHKPQASDELALNVDDLVAIIDMPDPSVSMWWRGKNKNKCGVFPYNCVKMIAQQKTPERGMINAGDETNSRAIGAALVVSPYAAQHPGELTLNVGELISLINAPPDQPLWKGKANAFTVGVFPRECVKLLTKNDLQDVDLAEARFHDYPSPFNSQTEILANPPSNNSNAYTQPTVSITRSGSERDKEKNGGGWSVMRKMSRQGTSQSLATVQDKNASATKSDGNSSAGSSSPGGTQSRRRGSLQPKLANLFGGTDTEPSASSSSGGASSTQKGDRTDKLIDPNSAGGLMRRVGGLFGGRTKQDEKSLPGLFGAELGEYLERTGQRLPLVVTACVEEIERRGPMEGLYRAGGSVKEINALKAAFEKDDRAVDVRGVDDVHVLAGTIKAYFRELPTPLLTYGLYQQFMAAGTSNQALHDVIMQLPPPHLRLLHYLLRHLHWVTVNKTQTLMDSRGLAIVWTPNVLRAPIETNETGSSNYFESHKYVFETLIKEVDNVDLFGPELATI
eukprot:comp21029_c0_seq1/m.28250 comp21029_c0_seq1/g.28250  ORF comp21029_c0_seq1/g.28250 comp21029_c0_seq1/m.28250 type:complete len:784 (-) comp21029_c0_seq1:568-2919(-)